MRRVRRIGSPLRMAFAATPGLASDPWIDDHLGESWVDASALAIPRSALDAMAWYGDPAYRCAVVLRPSPGRP